MSLLSAHACLVPVLATQVRDFAQSFNNIRKLLLSAETKSVEFIFFFSLHSCLGLNY